MAVHKQFTIEVRGTFEPEGDKAMRGQMQRLAQQAQTLLFALTTTMEGAAVVLFSDDFFHGHSELDVRPVLDVATKTKKKRK